MATTIDQDQPDRRRPREASTARRITSRACLLGVLASVPAEAASAAVSAFPGPGWKQASPTTELTFTGGAASGLGDLTIVGSSSGRHAGRLRELRDRPGVVFSPDEAFVPYERVTVTLPVRVRGAGGRRFSFRVAKPVPGQWKSPTAPELRVERSRGRGCRLRYRRLRTIAGPAPVRFCLRRTPSFKPRSRRLLIAPRPPNGATRRAPALMILANDGRTFWYRPRRGVVHDLNVARYRGEPVLTYYLRAQHGPDRHELLDRHYRRIARVVPGNGYTANAHELQLTRAGTAYVGSYEPVLLRNGSKVTDFVIQEIDVPTGDVLFEWHALDHVPVWATFARPRTDGWALDYFHGNSIEPPRDGGRTIVVSARKTSAVYGIDRRTGRVRWILGGKQDQFGLPPHLVFCAQHDVRRLPGGDLTVFDNGGTALAGGCPRHRARVERLRIDVARHQVTGRRVLWSDSSAGGHDGLWPAAVGSARWLPDGNVLVNWGNTGRITELSPTGRVRFKLQLAHWSYRAVYAGWRGEPGGRPAIAAKLAGGRLHVWASWNGHTSVHRWRVLAGATPDTLHRVAAKRFEDLETHLRAESGATYVAVQALDRRGRPLGQSTTIGVGSDRLATSRRAS